MLFYRVFVLLLSANFYQQYQEIRNQNLFILSTHNYSRDLTLNKLSVSAYEVTFANNLYIDICTTLSYHLKHNMIVPLSIHVEFKRIYHRLLLILILSGDISVNTGPHKHPCAIAISQLRNIIVLYCARPATTAATSNVIRFHQPSIYRWVVLMSHGYAVNVIPSNSLIHFLTVHCKLQI